MGTEFFKKLKKIFKKKDIKKDIPATATESAKQEGSPVKRSTQFVGDGRVFNVLRCVADEIDQMVEPGTMKPSRADALIGMLKAIEAEQVSDDVKLIKIIQTTGRIFNS